MYLSKGHSLVQILLVQYWKKISVRVGKTLICSLTQEYDTSCVVSTWAHGFLLCTWVPLKCLHVQSYANVVRSFSWARTWILALYRSVWKGWLRWNRCSSLEDAQWCVSTVHEIRWKTPVKKFCTEYSLRRPKLLNSLPRYISDLPFLCGQVDETWQFQSLVWLKENSVIHLDIHISVDPVWFLPEDAVPEELLTVEEQDNPDDAHQMLDSSVRYHQIMMEIGGELNSSENCFIGRCSTTATTSWGSIYSTLVAFYLCPTIKLSLRQLTSLSLLICIMSCPVTIVANQNCAVSNHIDSSHWLITLVLINSRLNLVPKYCMHCVPTTDTDTVPQGLLWDFLLQCSPS